MDIFTLNEAIERGIDRFCLVGESQIIELVFINGNLAPYALWYSCEDNIYRLPIKGFNREEKTFTYIQGINNFSEYFEKLVIPELQTSVNRMREKYQRNQGHISW